MEEKETFKLKLNTVLLIIAIIVIIIMGIFIGFLYKKNIENIKSEDNTANTENAKNSFSEAEIKEVLQKYLDLSGEYQGSPYSVLGKMKEITGKNVINDEYPEAIEYGEGSILPTNIKYSEFKEFMLNYMTEEVFNTDFARGYVDKDGDLYCKNIGATGVQYEVKSIEKIENSDKKYKGKIITILEVDAKEEWNILFEIENINNKCVISSFTFPEIVQDDIAEKENTENTSNTSENNSDQQNTQKNSNVSKDTTKNKIIGKWKADKVVDSNGDDIGLSAVWGTGISYSNEMEFKVDGILSYAIGITASSDDGTYTISGNTVKYGVPTDIKGNYDWHTAEYIEDEDIIKEEIDVVGEKAIVTYIRANKNQNNKTDKYKEITKKLDLNDKNFEEIFVVTDVEKNNGKYTLKGRVYKGYADSINQQGISFKTTDNYKKITVEEDTRCVYTNYNGSIDEEEVIKDTTAKNYFKDFKSITENPKPGELFPNYNFEFKNGKCTKITIKTIYI